MKLFLSKPVSPPVNSRLLTVLINIAFCSVIIGLTGGCEKGGNIQPRTYPDADSAAARLYLSKCSVCHAAPRPSQYKKAVWPGVVNRMQMRMKSKAITPLSDGEMQTVLTYLQGYASDAP